MKDKIKENIDWYENMLDQWQAIKGDDDGFILEKFPDLVEKFHPVAAEAERLEKKIEGAIPLIKVSSTEIGDPESYEAFIQWPKDQ